MKLLLVDLDDTLIDTSFFKKELFNNIALNLNVSVEAINDIYNNLKATHTMHNWKNNFQAQLSSLSKNDVNIDAHLQESIKKIPINKKVIEYVNKFDGRKILFSYGDPEVQKMKIDGLGLSELFSDHIITPNNKISSLKQMISGNSIFYKNDYYYDVTLIDNEESMLTVVKAQFPWIKVFHPDNLV